MHPRAAAAPRRRHRYAALAAAVVVATPLASAAAGPPGASGRPAAGAVARELPPIRHVFVIMLENQSYPGSFGTPRADPYLAGTLPADGALLTQYYGTGHESNDNYVSFVSGQAPNAENQADCQLYTDVVGAGLLGGQQTGEGCVYPAGVPTIGNQLSAAHLSWRAYLQDMGNDPARESATCGHPPLGGRDTTQTAVPGDGYVTRHDPFVYFHAVIDSPAYCARHVVPLGSPSGALPPGAPPGVGLATALRSAASTPNFVWITPNVCNDGHDYPCTNQPSGVSALADIDAFLATWVPKITHSPAFRQGGLLEVTFDESDGPQSDSSACCGESPGPGSPLPGITGPGGGRVGAVLLSPFIRPGTRSATPYNHYASLASIEALFGLPRLGAAAGVRATFGRDVFTGWAGPQR